MVVKIPRVCDRIISGLADGRSLEYTIFVETFRRSGRALDVAQCEKLVVRESWRMKTEFNLRGCIDAVHFGTVRCLRSGRLYICRIRRSNASAKKNGQAALTKETEAAALPRSLEIQE